MYYPLLYFCIPLYTFIWVLRYEEPGGGAVHCSGHSTIEGLTERSNTVALPFVLFYQTLVTKLRKIEFVPEICIGIVG